MQFSFRRSAVAIVPIAVLLGLMLVGRAFGSSEVTVTHGIPPGPLPMQNPLKGLIAYSDDYSFPHSMDWFYLPVNAVQKGPDTFDWSALEAKLNEIAARGDQACFRFYYDSPASPNGIPAFLLAPGKDRLATSSYTEYGGGMSPDYNSDQPGSRLFRQSMQKFIAAFGARYDGDPRIGYITVGLLGFWGEWHTYPHVDWTPSDATMNLVLDAYLKAFHKTRLLVRYPVASAPTLPIGYHDDAFCAETLYEHPWEFAARLKAADIPNIWQKQPIGGEVMPPLQNAVFPTAGTGTEPWPECVAAVHPTWLIDDQIKNYSGATRVAAIQASEEMGYNFRVDTATYGNVARTGALRLGVHIDNIGIAPFYYRWKVLVGVLKGGAVVKSWDTDWDITRIAAGTGANFAFDTTRKHGLKAGGYTLAIRVVNPMPHGKPLLFANAGQSPDGWLSLGAIDVK